MKLICICIITIRLTLACYSQSPYLVSPEGKYLGNLNDNPYDLNSVANPYGKYGSEDSLDSVNNSCGIYGSEYSLRSPNNPYSTHGAPRIYSPDGTHLGRLSCNPYDLDSTGNPSGVYGSSYSLTSINNPDGQYGSEYSPKSATFLYGNSYFKEKKKTYTYIKPIYSTLATSDSISYENEPFEQQSQLTDMLLKQNAYLRSTLNKNNAKLNGVTQTRTASTSPFHITLDSDGIQALSKEFNKVNSILQKHKEALLAFSLVRSFDEIREYVIPVEEYDGLQENARQPAQSYVGEKIGDFKEILLKEE